MQNIQAMLQSAEEQLNDAYVIYQEKYTGLAGEFDQIKLQTTIFQYEICLDIVAFVTNNPIGFARNVSLKGVIHKLFEYELLISGNLTKRVTDLAVARGLTNLSINLKNEKRKWQSQFKKLSGWADIRNTATGHYDRDTNEQVKSLEAINPQEVMDICAAFLSFNMAFLGLLAEVGKN
jgi:FtsZ-binding cell division protein ZapB